MIFQKFLLSAVWGTGCRAGMGAGHQQEVTAAIQAEKMMAGLLSVGDNKGDKMSSGSESCFS